MSGEDGPKRGIFLVAAAAEGKLDLLREVLRSGTNVHHDDDLALRGAVCLGQLEAVKILLEHGANVHADQEFSLFIAVKKRDYEIIEALLEKGADAQAVLDHRKAELDPENLQLIAGIQNRAARAIAEKDQVALREKARASGRGILKPKSP